MSRNSLRFSFAPLSSPSLPTLPRRNLRLCLVTFSKCGILIPPPLGLRHFFHLPLAPRSRSLSLVDARRSSSSSVYFLLYFLPLSPAHESHSLIYSELSIRDAPRQTRRTVFHPLRRPPLAVPRPLSVSTLCNEGTRGEKGTFCKTRPLGCLRSLGLGNISCSPPK